MATPIIELHSYNILNSQLLHMNSLFAGVVVSPSAPLGPINVKNLSPSSMMVSWKAPPEDGGGPIEGYIIEQREILEADVCASFYRLIS